MTAIIVGVSVGVCAFVLSTVVLVCWVIREHKDAKERTGLRQLGKIKTLDKDKARKEG